MITMYMIEKIRRMKMRDQLSDREICRRTGLARNTVKMWLNSPGDIQPKYSRMKSNGKLTTFIRVLEQALRTDSHRPNCSISSSSSIVSAPMIAMATVLFQTPK